VPPCGLIKVKFARPVRSCPRNCQRWAVVQ